MSFTFKSAKRENVPLLIGIAGASGSGKTFSALELATGIAEEMARVQGGAPIIAAIDSERRRMLHYADDFRFLHGDIEPPFRPQRYGQAIEAAEGLNPHVVVIDSFSHEFEGEGGIRDWADELEEGGMKPPKNWSEPKLEHKKLVNQMLRSKAHIIVCLRAEEKMRVEMVPQFERDGETPKMWNGKQSTKMVITPATELELRERWVPITEKRFPYEITTSLLLTPDNPGVPIPLKLQKQHRPMFPEDRQISRESGRRLARWAMGDELTLEQARIDISNALSLEELAGVWMRRTMAPFRDQLQDAKDARKDELTPKQQEQDDGRQRPGDDPRDPPAGRGPDDFAGGAGSYDGGYEGA